MHLLGMVENLTNVFVIQGPVVNVQITRMASKEIQDRQRMFELLELLQASIHFCNRQNKRQA